MNYSNVINRYNGSLLANTLKNIVGLGKQKVSTDYFQEFVTGSVFQLLESTYIIETSTIPDMLLRRYQFFKSRRKELIIQKNNSRFNADFQQGIISYKKTYPERQMNSAQINLIEADDNEIETYFLYHYKRCCLGYTADQNKKVKQTSGKKYEEITNGKGFGSIMQSLG